MGCVSDVIKDVWEAGRSVFAEMEVRGRGLGCRGRVPGRGLGCRAGCRAGGWDAGHGVWVAAPPARCAGLVCVPCLRLEPQAADFGIPLAHTGSLISAAFLSHE